MQAPTRERIIAAASTLFYADGVRSVGMDLIAEGAGVTKRTLYYHFRSKDDLVAACLQGWDEPTLARFQRWFDATDGDLAEKLRGVFARLAESARAPNWKGCGFLRTTAELADMPGHPAVRVGAAHKKAFEAWVQRQAEAAHVPSSSLLARQIMLLLDGAFAVSLLHRDPSYIDTAGEAACALARAALRYPTETR